MTHTLRYVGRSSSKTRKLFLYGVVIVFALWLLDTEIIKDLVIKITPLKYVAEFVAGALYTTVLTVPLSIALLASLSEVSNIYLIVAIGSIGAVFGDFLLMNIVTRIRRTILIRKEKRPRHAHKIPKPFLIIAGIACLALPVPDEVAMTLLGISEIRTKTFIFVVYPAKAIGIFFVTLFAANVLV